MTIQDRISKDIKDNPIVLFMKGIPEMPACGFSAQAVQILQSSGIPFTTFDVLEDEELRSEIKVYSNWPTIPQLYINGEFIGGSDIIFELLQSGELLPKLKAVRKG
jgi:monothiol glutaredoxin